MVYHRAYRIFIRLKWEGLIYDTSILVIFIDSENGVVNGEVMFPTDNHAMESKHQCQCFLLKDRSHVRLTNTSDVANPI